MRQACRKIHTLHNTLLPTNTVHIHHGVSSQRTTAFLAKLKHNMHQTQDEGKHIQYKGCPAEHLKEKTVDSVHVQAKQGTAAAG